MIQLERLKCYVLKNIKAEVLAKSEILSPFL